MIKRIANSVDPDETAHYEPSHPDLHCLHKYLFWVIGPKGLSYIQNRSDCNGQRDGERDC